MTPQTWQSCFPCCSAVRGGRAFPASLHIQVIAMFSSLHLSSRSGHSWLHLRKTLNYNAMVPRATNLAAQPSECSMSQPHAPWSAPEVLKKLCMQQLQTWQHLENPSVPSWKLCEESSVLGQVSPMFCLYKNKRLAEAVSCENLGIFLQVLLDTLLWQLLLQGEWSSLTPHPLTLSCLHPVPSALYVPLCHLHCRCFSFKIYPWWENLPSASKCHLLKSANISLKFCGILVSLSLKLKGV